ncbi:MAG: hypothetical protein ACOH2P_10180 [Pseudomonas sp.]
MTAIPTATVIQTCDSQGKVSLIGRREHPLFLVQCCGVNQYPIKGSADAKFWKGVNNIDQQSWPMREAVSRD